MAHFGTQTPAAYDNVALGLIYNGVSSRSMRHLPPTDRDFHAAGGAFRHADARGLFTAGRSSYYNGVSSRSMRRLRPTARDVHSVGGALRHADVRGLFTAWRSSYYNGVSARSMRRPSAYRPRFPLSRRRPSARRRPRRVSPRQRGTHAPSFFPHMRRTGG